MIRARLLTLALLVPLVAAPGRGGAEEVADATAGVSSEPNGWTPGMEMILEVFDFQGQAAVQSQIRQDGAASGRRTIETFRMGLHLSSPTLDLGIVSPRFFFAGGAQVGPEQTVRMEQVGAPAYLQPESLVGLVQRCDDPVPPPRPPQICGPPTAPVIPPWPAPETFEGQFSSIDGRYEGLGWYANFGATFAVPGTTDHIRVRPSVTYQGEQVTAIGELVSVTGIGPDYVIHRILRESKEDLHYLGPSLAIDLVLTEGRRAEIATFVQADLLWNVGDPVIAFAEPGTATFTFRTADFRYMLGFGVRLSWRNMFGGR